MKTKDTSETSLCLQRFLTLSEKPERIYTDNSKESIEAWSSFAVESRHRPPSSLRIERSGTAVARVQSDLPEVWWDIVMERYCYLRNVHDKMADGKTAFENVLGKNLTDHSFLSDR